MTSDTDARIQEAFERLMLGRPEITDGALTISNICAEAGVSRASYYRSSRAAAIKRLLDAPQTQRPEVEDLRDQVKQLKKADRQLRADHAAEVRELRETVKVYANQIQVLALHAAQLRDDNYRLHTSLAKTDDRITLLDSRRQTVVERHAE
jgi:AcrR family transcriptional regulator